MKKKRGFHDQRSWVYQTLLKMKLTIFILLFSIMGTLASQSYSQTTKLTLNVRDVRVEDFLKHIENQSEYRFFYSGKINVDQKISGDFDNKSINVILDKALENTGIKYEINGRQIVLSSSTVGMIQEQVSVSGKVTDSSGVPLPGVTVAVKGTTSGTITDPDGNYTLKNVPGDGTLVFSFVGMKTQEIQVMGKNSIDVILEENTIGLDEVVAIGYGTVKKSDLTGAVGVIKADRLDQQINTNVGGALQGKMAGVSIESSGGLPGAEMNIQIRGAGSLNNNLPLILVDNIPITSLNNLNPSDIASMEVLKDASAAAIYGSRAANGVILITTKGGKKGPMKIDVNVDFGLQQVSKKLSVCNTDEWIKVITAASDAAGMDIPEIAKNPEEPGVGINWQDQIYRTAPVQNYSVGASGGSENLTYNLSLGYLSQDGVIKKTDYDRLNLRFKTDFTKGRLKIGETVLLSKEKAGNLGGAYETSVYMSEAALKMIPAFSIYDPEAIGGYNGAWGAVNNIMNPVAIMNLRHAENNIYKAQVNMYAEVNILDGLKYKFDAGLTTAQERYRETVSAYEIGQFFSNPTNLMDQKSGATNLWQIENTLSYSKVLHEKHSINAVIGQTALQNKYDEFSASKKGMPDGVWVMGAGSIDPVANGTASENTLSSYFGRLIYSYDNRYIFTGTFRRDGSSRFSSSNRWGNFPSVSVAWNAANESFFKNLDTPISQLKLRTSYGKLGNQEIGDYQYLGSITSGVSYAVGNPNHLWVGNIQTEYVPSKLKWETTATSNVGIDLGLWNGKLSYSLDFYKKTTTDLLLRIPIPLSVGADQDPYGNAGKISNNGYEMILNYNGKHRDFTYSLTGTLSHVKNEVKELSTGSQVLTGGRGSGGGPTITYTQVGYPIYSFFEIKTDGLFRSEAEIAEHSKNGNLIQPNAQVGDIRFVDANNDGKIDGNDRVYCGSPFPKFEYGLRLDGAWKFIDASIFIQGVHGNKIYNGIRSNIENEKYVFNVSTDLLDSYTFNPNSDYPRLDLSDPNGNGIDNSDRFLEDGSYLRLKSVQIGFTLPANWLNSLSISKCRLYLGADNLITWTNYKGFNPDIGNSSMENRGIDFRQIPLSRSCHFGLQLNF
ncbi:TonB-dependent receptor [Sunxiuqinia indica]|uniref:TonB-dependent receptor n=1 Tax=Sunxiuqinia indica TaxID=2692584 RepID=UPI0013586865|nr:TonB-dependent receptor [Sunxiuqinia indica]